MPKKDNYIPERRRYIRLKTVFPVQFRLISPDGKQFLSDELQGFTNNIGRGGICLVINNLKPESAALINQKQIKLSLNIELPVMRKLIPAIARVAWVKEDTGISGRYLVGLCYEQINLKQNNRIMRYAWTKKLFVPVTSAIIIMLGLAMAINSFISIKLIKGNKALVEQLVKIVQESSVAKQKIKDITKQSEDLQLKIQTLQSRIETVNEGKENLTKASKLKETETMHKIEELGSLVEKLIAEKTSLQEELIALQRQEGAITEELLHLDKKKSHLEKANLDKMYQWLKIHQNPRTGLVISFEGDSDIRNFAFIYDEALVIQAYANFSDFERARKILNFFVEKAKRKEGLFFNAYYATDGEPAEYVVQSGPNIWLGIAILQYTNKTSDTGYLTLAEDIAKRVIDLQDNDGGIRAGPNLEWYATEHNLDAYAFFNMLYNITAKTLYLERGNKVLDWLIRHTYDNLDIPIKRGKGDSTIATDTYAWTIAAIGPGKLNGLGMNPDRIIEFAETNCSVEVDFIRPEGNTIKIKGFDFAPQKNIARGGVVSSEWTAQMILAFKIMGDFYYKMGLKAKAHSYEMKADEYMAQLGKMIISSASPSGQGESCLPYATQDFVDTGHGWRTPKGKSTGSVASTTYALFAYYNYNPLELKK